MGILDLVNERKSFLKNLREKDPSEYVAEVGKLKGPLAIMASGSKSQGILSSKQVDISSKQLDATTVLSKAIIKGNRSLETAIKDMSRQIRQAIRYSSMGGTRGGSLLDDALDLFGNKKGTPAASGGKTGRLARLGQRISGSSAGRSIGSVASKVTSLGSSVVGKAGSIVEGGTSLLGKGLGKGASAVGSFFQSGGAKSMGSVLSKLAVPLAAAGTVMSVSEAQDKAAAEGKSRTGAGSSSALSSAATLGMGSLIGINSTGDLAESIGNAVTFGMAKSSMGSVKSAVDGGFDSVGEGIESFMTSSGMGDMIGRTMTAFAAPFSQDARDTLSSDFENNIIPGFSKTFTDFNSSFSTSMGKVTDYGNALADGAGSIWKGIKAAAVTVYKGAGDAVDAAKKGYEKGGVKGAVEATSTSVATTGAKAVGSLKGGLQEAYTGLGAVSHKYESGKAGVSSISTGKGDAGGVSYGTYQLSSKTGTAKAFVDSKEGAQFSSLKGLTPGSAEFNAAYKNLASGEQKGAFAEAQHEYIKRTHYDAAASSVAKATGIDLNSKGRGVQEALFSSSVQYGAGGAAGKFKKVLASVGKDASDEDIIKALQKDKMDNVDSNFRSSSQAVRDSARRRIANEEKDLLAVNASKAPPAISPEGTKAKMASPVAAVPPTPEQKTVLVASTESPKSPSTTGNSPTSSVGSGSSGLAPSLNDIPPFFPDLAMMPVLTGTV